MSEAITDDEVTYYAAVVCRGDSVPGQQSCGQVKINEAEYERQMNRPDSLWMCPHCGSTADFDDEYFEKAHEIADEPAQQEDPAFLKRHVDELRSMIQRLLTDARETSSAANRCTVARQLLGEARELLEEAENDRTARFMELEALEEQDADYNREQPDDSEALRRG